MQHADVGSTDARVSDRNGVATVGSTTERQPGWSTLDSVAVALAVGRATLAVAMLAAPGLTGRLWLGEGDSTTRRRLMRVIGLRDAVLSAGTLLSGRRRPWLLASATADAADAVASVAAAVVTRRVQPLRVVAMAVGGAVTGVVVAGRQPSS